LSVLSLHGESKKQHTEGDCALFNTYSSSALPRAERFRPRVVRKSSPIGIANSAMPSRLLAMHSCSMLCFRLCHRLIAGGYATSAQRAHFGTAFEASKAPAFRTVACGERFGSTWGPPWTVFGTSVERRLNWQNR